VLATGIDGTPWVGTSVAEDMMAKYGDPDKKKRNPCRGCGSSDRSFANCKTITCPNMDKPGVMDRAAKARNDFNGKLAAKKKAASNKRDSSETPVISVGKFPALPRCVAPMDYNCLSLPAPKTQNC
jgi:hypothetical protein